MRQRRFILVSLAFVLSIGFALGGYGIGRALDIQIGNSHPQQQSFSVAPPTILYFASEANYVTVAQAEAGNVQTVLRWQVLGMRSGDYLTLSQYQGNAWVSMLNPFSTPLEATGQFAVFIQHPLNFGPITYRLAVYDSSNAVQSEQFLLIPYSGYSNQPPGIELFTARQNSIDANVLNYQGGTISLAWRVLNRPMGTNLVFEQVLENGSAVSVELPRTQLWVASTGEGVVAPRLPERAKVFVLRIRLVNVSTGQTLDQREVSIQVTGILLRTPTAVVTPSVTPFNAN